ncbi:hypothetical protein ZHAS_00002110 [Anopheles sinensis]|uniref:Uncharacterized protein n=1 Tax=Anopheles sinensis TaxID=74873 RepID=A0A084VBS8_ANOSI|nr:hypothetical protein ZHAS_00002110 [Anopheles sinensis]
MTDAKDDDEGHEDDGPTGDAFAEPFFATVSSRCHQASSVRERSGFTGSQPSLPDDGASCGQPNPLSRFPATRRLPCAFAPL